MSEEFCRDRQSIRRPVEANCSVFLLLPRINGLPQKHCMEGLSRHNSPLIRRKNPTKFENDRISRNGHRIKITQPNWMIKASFSSAEDAPSNDVKIYNTFSSQCTENPPFRFFWDTRYIYKVNKWNEGRYEAFLYQEHWRLPRHERYPSSSLLHRCRCHCHDLSCVPREVYWHTYSWMTQPQTLEHPRHHLSCSGGPSDQPENFYGYPLWTCYIADLKFLHSHYCDHLFIFNKCIYSQKLEDHHFQEIENDGKLFCFTKT